MIHKILTWPHVILKTPAESIPTINNEVKVLINDMFETMYDAQGIGLAANQIGITKKIFILDTGGQTPQKLVFINPALVSKSGTILFKEGCLSVPDEREEVERAAVVEIEYQDETGAHLQRRFEGLMSIAVQHELDHLNGIVYVEKLSELKRSAIRKRLRKRVK